MTYNIKKLLDFENPVSIDSILACGKMSKSSSITAFKLLNLVAVLST